MEQILNRTSQNNLQLRRLRITASSCCPRDGHDEEPIEHEQREEYEGVVNRLVFVLIL